MSKKSLIVIVVILAVILAACVAAIVVLPMLTSSQQGDRLDSAVVDQASEDVQADAADSSAPDGEDPADIQGDGQGNDQENDQNGETVAESTGPVVDDATIPNLPEGVTAPASDEVTYEIYQAMTGEEQMVFMDSFESMDAFFAWYNAAKEEYEAKQIEIDGTAPIDMSEIVGGN